MTCINTLGHPSTIPRVRKKQTGVPTLSQAQKETSGARMKSHLISGSVDSVAVVVRTNVRCANTEGHYRAKITDKIVIGAVFQFISLINASNSFIQLRRFLLSFEF